MKKILLIALAITSALIQGCAMRGPISPEYQIQNKKMAVVSELGNNFQHVIVGTTVFTNNITKSDVRDWRVNHTTAAYLISKLGERGTHADEVESDFFTSLDDGSPYTIGTVRDKVISKVKAMGYQSLLIVRPTTADNYPFFRPGYGLHTRYFFGTPKSCIYAMYILELYDLEKDKTIGWDWVNAMNGPCILNSANDLPVKESFNEFSDKEKTEIRQRLESWIKTSLDTTLKSMQITP
jgi:hypothetical protein